MDSLLERIRALSLQDAFVADAAVAFAFYLVFKRWEPKELSQLVVLLIAVPAVLTPILAQHYNVLTATALTFATYISTILTSTVLYRLSPFHPLAKYPGPILCKISKIYFTARSLGGKQHIIYQQLHRKYGDVVRIGPNELSFGDPAAIGPMMGTTGFPKGPWWEGRMPHKPGQTRSLLALRDNAEHHARRRPWNRAFTSAALKDYEKIVERRSLQLMDKLGETTGTGIDLAIWFGYFTWDFMNDMVFDGGSELLRDGDKDGLWHLLEKGQPEALVMSDLPWLTTFYHYVPGFGDGIRAFRDYAVKRAIERKKTGSLNKDLFYHLFDEAGLEPKQPTLPQVLSDAAPAVLAGADTTSTALANIVYCILTYPKTYERLQREIDALSSEDLLSSTAHAKLPYVNAVINEALRLFPPVASGSQRAPAIGSGGALIGPNFVPEGTSTSVHFYTLHRDSRNFSPLPDAFVPERWLSPAERDTLEPALFKGGAVHNAAAFVPFSFGPRNCVGKNLAYMEMREVLCLLLTRFTIRWEDPKYGAEWEDNLRDYFVLFKGRLGVVLTERKKAPVVI